MLRSVRTRAGATRTAASRPHDAGSRARARVHGILLAHRPWRTLVVVRARVACAVEYTIDRRNHVAGAGRTVRRADRDGRAQVAGAARQQRSLVVAAITHGRSVAGGIPVAGARCPRAAIRGAPAPSTRPTGSAPAGSPVPAPRPPSSSASSTTTRVKIQTPRQVIRHARENAANRHAPVAVRERTGAGGSAIPLAGDAIAHACAARGDGGTACFEARAHDQIVGTRGRIVRGRPAGAARSAAASQDGGVMLRCGLGRRGLSGACHGEGDARQQEDDRMSAGSHRLQS